MTTPDVPPRTAPFPFKRILALLRPERWHLFAATVFLGLGSAMGLLFPQGIRLVVDEVVHPKEGPSHLDRIVLMMLGVFFIQGVAIAVRGALFNISGERSVARLREELFRRLLDQEVAFFDERKTGELLSRISSDTTMLQSMMGSQVALALRLGASVVGGIGFLVYTSPRLTALMLVVFPPLAFAAVAYGRRLRRISLAVQDAVAGSIEVATEVIAGIRTVRTFVAEESEARRYGAAVWRSFSLARRRSFMNAAFMGVSTSLLSAAAALVFWYGGGFVLRGTLTIGELTSFLIYTLFVTFSLGELSEVFGEIMKSGGAATRVFEILDRTPHIPPSGGLTPADVKGRIALEAVSFSYPTRRNAPVLSKLDFSMHPGEVVALVGPSGAGKSTIATLLLRHYDPDEGRVSLDERDLRELDPGWLRRQIGVVSQEPILFSSSIADNIRYGRPDASVADVEAAARAANAHDFIARFPQGYHTIVGERGTQLSGGQKQRVAIARALLKNPPILILDEATSALDANSEHLVQEALERLMVGRTTVVIAHRLSTVRGADRVIVLEGGHVVQNGCHAALITEDGLYRRLVERQLTGTT